MCQLAARRQDQGNVMMDGSQEPSNYNLKWEREKKKEDVFGMKMEE